MGKPSAPTRDSKRRPTIPDRYTDEPLGSSSSAIPLLIHSDYDEDARGPDDELPGYSDDRDEEVGADEDAPPSFERYQPVVKKIRTKLGMGDILTVSHDEHLNTDGEALYRYVLFYSPIVFLAAHRYVICIRSVAFVYLLFILFT